MESRPTRRAGPLVRRDEQALAQAVSNHIVGLATRFGWYGYHRVPRVATRRVESEPQKGGADPAAGRLERAVQATPERSSFVERWSRFEPQAGPEEPRVGYDFVLPRLNKGRPVRLLTSTQARLSAFSSGVGEGIHHSVVQSHREFLRVGVSDRQ